MNRISIVGALFHLLVASPFAFAQNEIVESTFCLSMSQPECKIPCVVDAISLSQIQTTKDGEKRLYFWTKVRVKEDKNIMHVWSAKDRNEEWAEPVQVAWSDKIKNLALEMVREAKVFLSILQKSDPRLDNVQGVMLPVNRSPRFRTYSSIRANLGDYTVAVYDLNRQLIPGGEPKTIKIVP